MIIITILPMSDVNLSTDSALTLYSRPRSLRRTVALRRMVRETQISVDDLVYPLFVISSEGQKVEIGSI